MGRRLSVEDAIAVETLVQIGTSSGHPANLRRVIHQQAEWLEARSRSGTQRIQLASRLVNERAALSGRPFQG